MRNSADIWVNLNGALVPQHKAHLPITDRSILFGDGVYEVMAIHHGCYRDFDRHYQRLIRSLELIELAAPFSADTLKQACDALLAKNQLNGDSMIYVQVTRGISFPRDFNYEEDAQANYFIQARAFEFPTLATLQNGYRAISHEDLRRVNCSIKSTCLQTSAMLKHKAVKAQAEEAILHRDDLLTEGSSSNVFMVKDGVIVTPPLTINILPGITRAIVLELATELQIPVLEQPILFADLYHADELFISSTTRTLKPIIQLDDTIIGDGKAGPVWSKLIKAYQKRMEKLS